VGDGISETIDAFHRGRFHILQPKGRGHRAGMDAMLLASLVADDRPCRIADLGKNTGDDFREGQKHGIVGTDQFTHG
jgi:tRNA1(Val) A37 N6-methylase TrmN6